MVGNTRGPSRDGQEQARRVMRETVPVKARKLANFAKIRLLVFRGLSLSLSDTRRRRLPAPGGGGQTRSLEGWLGTGPALSERGEKETTGYEPFELTG